MCQHISPKTAIYMLGKQAGQTGGSLCPLWRSDLFVGASRALLCVEIRLDPHAKQGKGENSRQIKDEDLLCVGASRPEERGKQPTD